MAARETSPHPARATPARRVPVTLWLLPLLHVGSCAAFAVLRDHQLSLPDPYDNPYTDWSTACLGLSFLLWLAGLAWLLSRAARRRRVPAVVWAWLGIATLLVLTFFYNMLRFLFP